MVFTIALTLSLTIFGAGCLYRGWKWFHVRIGPEAAEITPTHRVAAAAKGIGSALFSRRVLLLAKAFLLDVLLQVRVLREDALRWLMHMSLFYGFFLLLFMHALEDVVSTAIFADYASTLNPYLFLRNLFGALLLLGVVLAMVQRFRRRRAPQFTNITDRIAVAILALVMLSGFFLESTKILSPSLFDEMVDEYASISDDEELDGLKRYWARDFGVVFQDLTEPAGDDAMEIGMELHEESCVECHSSPKTAFISYPLARLLEPAAPILEREHARVGLWRLHIMVCLIGLAILPFTKLFHLVTGPVSLMTDAVASPPEEGEEAPVNRVTRRALALDACVHCGTCSDHCSVGPVFDTLTNPAILPSEKLLSIRRSAGGDSPADHSMEALSEGTHVCTLCTRCTTVCPVGIDLQDLWIASRSDLAARELPGPHVRVLEKSTAHWADRIAEADRVTGQEAPTEPPDAGMAHAKQWVADRTESFSACVQCLTCTNVCPVVACSEDPQEDLGLTPQQIINLLRLGMKEWTLGSKMVWNCATCYMCQEHCPEGIRVADILYELRNLGHHRFTEVRRAEEGRPTAEALEELEESGGDRSGPDDETGGTPS